MKTDSEYISRRQWLGAMARPSLAAIGATALASRAISAEPGQLPPSAAPALGVGAYNIRDFGAKGDGVALDTGALQAAIDACSRAGGGTVLVPAGVFHIGTVELKSNITLHLAASATLLGSADGKQYRPADAIPLRGDSTLGDGHWALLFAVEAKNVTIEGPGMIDGQGQHFRSPVRGQLPPSGLGGNQRPYHLLFYRCENLQVRGLRLVRGAYHSVRVIQSRHIQVDGIHIHNRVNGNNDGFHFISAEYVSLTNSTVLCQDDACALFGNCQFVTVNNCVFSTRWSVFRFGGGWARNIAVSNCVIYDTYGCPIKLSASMARMEDMSFSNLIMNNVTGPIGIGFSGASGRGREDGGAPPVENPAVRNISFHNIRATVAAEPSNLSDGERIGSIHDGEQNSCITLNGVGDVFIENISFHDVHVTYAGGGTSAQAAKRNVPAMAREYFGVWSEPPFGPPAYGLYARNVKALTLCNVRFEVSTADLRPAVILDNVQDVVIDSLSVQGNTEAESVLRFTHVSDAVMSAARLLTPAATFLQLESSNNRGITIDGGDFRKATKVIDYKDGASENAVRLRV